MRNTGTWMRWALALVVGLGASACGGEAADPPATGTTGAGAGTPSEATPGETPPATPPVPAGPAAPAVLHTALSIGPNGGCALDASGAPLCWSVTAPPTAVPGGGTLVDVAVGETMGCGTDAAGAITCWSMIGGAAPVAPSGTFVDVDFIGDVLCAVTGDGRVLCPLAEAGAEARPCGMAREPAASCFVAGLEDAVEIAGGGGRACVRRRGGEVSCWTADVPAAVAIEITGAVEIGADADIVCARTDAGVSCRGSGAAALTAPAPATPEPPEGAPPPETPPVAPTELATIELPELRGATRIVVRADGLCARLSDATWHCAGDDSTARFGDGATGQRQPPILATAFGSASEVALSDVAGCALDGTTVRCTGLGDRGALGPEARRTVFRAHRAISAPTDATTRATDLLVLGDATCARAGEHLRCWGPAEWHEHVEGLSTEARPRRISPSHLGLRGRVPAIVDGWAVADITRCSLSPAGLLQCHEEVHRREGVRSMASGPAGTCTLHLDGTIECLRHLDDGGIFFETAAREDPEGVVDLAVGPTFVCVLGEDGGVLCAGAHEALGLPLPRRAPTAAEGESPPWIEVADVEAAEIAAGDGSLCFRTPEGGASCVGRAVDPTHAARPVEIAPANVERVVGGNGFGCALVRTPEAPAGDVVCLSSESEMLAHDMSHSTATHWTHRSIAGLLDHFDAAAVLPPVAAPATAADPAAPAPVLEVPSADPAVRGLVELVAGPSHACVLRSDGAVYCWGHDLVGQLGAVPHALRLEPVTMSLVPAPAAPPAE